MTDESDRIPEDFAKIIGVMNGARERVANGQIILRAKDLEDYTENTRVGLLPWYYEDAQMPPQDPIWDTSRGISQLFNPPEGPTKIEVMNTTFPSKSDGRDHPYYPLLNDEYFKAIYKGLAMQVINGLSTHLNLHTDMLPPEMIGKVMEDIWHVEGSEELKAKVALPREVGGGEVDVRIGDGVMLLTGDLVVNTIAQALQDFKAMQGDAEAFLDRIQNLASDDKVSFRPGVASKSMIELAGSVDKVLMTSGALGISGNVGLLGAFTADAIATGDPGRAISAIGALIFTAEQSTEFFGGLITRGNRMGKIKEGRFEFKGHDLKNFDIEIFMPKLLGALMVANGISAAGHFVTGEMATGFTRLISLTGTSLMYWDMQRRQNPGWDEQDGMVQKFAKSIPFLGPMMVSSPAGQIFRNAVNNVDLAEAGAGGMVAANYSLFGLAAFLRSHHSRQHVPEEDRQIILGFTEDFYVATTGVKPEDFTIKDIEAISIGASVATRHPEYMRNNAKDLADKYGLEVDIDEMRSPQEILGRGLFGMVSHVGAKAIGKGGR